MNHIKVKLKQQVIIVIIIKVTIIILIIVVIKKTNKQVVNTIIRIVKGEFDIQFINSREFD